MAKLTSADFERMYDDERWLGFGYLGERRNAREMAAHRELGWSKLIVADADAKALETANALGMDYEALFQWANSKNGRWFGDCVFGAHGRHASLYLPGQPQH